MSTVRVSDALNAIREHLRAADGAATTILRADTHEEQVATVRRTQALADLGLVRLVRESVDYEVGGSTRVATIESAATDAGRETRDARQQWCRCRGTKAVRQLVTATISSTSPIGARQWVSTG